MKFVTITGGLGNQMFNYALCEELRTRGYNSVLFIPYKANSKKRYGHQGYELEKIFPVRPSENVYTQLINYLLIGYSHFLRMAPVRLRSKWYPLVGVHVVSVPENFIFHPEVFTCSHRHELFRGTWQSERFFEHAKDHIRQAFIFKKHLLNSRTKEIDQIIRQENSISIHIRRGDYLSNQYAYGFAGVCTPEYYTNAINLIKDKVDNPRYYIFTDDSEWVKENFRVENSIYIQHNTGSDSWQDMYLMSQCKHNIIANSSFSWWGAWLNSNPDKIVIAPKRWWRLFEKDDVVPNEWIRL
jgi:hypothetical protein